MATTTNYGFEVPDDTDLVKDGALAMRDLGQDVDTQLFTALGGDYPGLRLIKKQTIGTAVASVTVTGAFSATYDNYLIQINGASSSNAADLSFQLSGSTGSTYQNIFNFFQWGTAGNSVANALSARPSVAQMGGSSNYFCSVEVRNPFATGITFAEYHGGGTTYNGLGRFYDSNSASHTGFNIAGTAGTLTGGTIYVYGYGAS
jgi:hypothetical protein